MIFSITSLACGGIYYTDIPGAVLYGTCHMMVHTTQTYLMMNKTPLRGEAPIGLSVHTNKPTNNIVHDI